jgi:hypothetical protein
MIPHAHREPEPFAPYLTARGLIVAFALALLILTVAYVFTVGAILIGTPE